jgi:hypothetical protein
VHILKVPAQITTLSESLGADVAGEGSLACVFAEVVSEVATLFKGRATACETAFEEHLDSGSLWVPHLDGLVPVLGDSFESTGVNVIRFSHLLVLSVLFLTFE